MIYNLPVTVTKSSIVTTDSLAPGNNVTRVTHDIRDRIMSTLGGVEPCPVKILTSKAAVSTMHLTVWDQMHYWKIGIFLFFILRNKVKQRHEVSDSLP